MSKSRGLRKSKKDNGRNQANLKKQNPVEEGNLSSIDKSGIITVKNKKRCMIYGLDTENKMGQNTELLTGFEEEELEDMDQDTIATKTSKNGTKASSLEEVRLPK